jgi:hypothetical protein
MAGKSKSFNPYAVTKNESGHKITLTLSVIPIHSITKSAA